jgi:predicted permease
MSIWSRLANVFRKERLIEEIDEELRHHLDEAVAEGRDPVEARKAFGSMLRRREESQDIRLLPWLDALRADVSVGWRRLSKSKATTSAAVLSLGLAIGACAAAFRLADALLLRPLPVDAPERLYVVAHLEAGPDGAINTSDGCDYPLFLSLREAAGGMAELIAISYAERVDLTYGSDQELEKAYRQYVSGWMFGSFGLRPALGRLLTRDDDVNPRAHPYAVLSHEYWTHRFGQDPSIIGRTFRVGDDLYEIVGVAEERFTGTEPGTLTDVFVPATMHPGVSRVDWSWLRAFVRIPRDVDVETVRERLQATFRTVRQETAKQFAGRPRQTVERFLHERIRLEAAAAGVSAMQKDYRRALVALGVLVAIVLLMACANVANLMTAQAAARSHEMALRASIGAGRRRIVQLVVVECALIAGLATAIGTGLAWWSAPLVASLINPPDNPARLPMPADWRILGFGLVLAMVATCLCGLTPALRASATRPMSVLRRGAARPDRRRTMHALIGLQVAFCMLVHIVAGLFVVTFQRLSSEPVGFAAERLLAIDVVAPRARPGSWNEVASHLASVPGVEGVAMSAWPLLSGNTWNAFVSIDGALQERRPSFLTVSPGWAEVMRIPLIDGRDFTADDAYPGVAIVNEAFARQFFDGRNPVGRWFEETPSRGNALPKEAAGTRYRVRIVGLVRDARYQTMREPFPPTVYVPFQSVDAGGVAEPINWGTFMVRTAGPDPMALASVLRREVPRARSEFRVSNVRAQLGLNQSHTVRERLLASLAAFFAAVALLLAGVGLSGVLHYSVIQRRREIGIRLALGASGGDVARRVTMKTGATVVVGALAGLALGLASERYVDALLYQVRVTDAGMLVLPSIAILAVAMLASISAVVRAVRIDPLTMLRED